MNLEFRLKGSWPKLAWVAVLEPQDERFVVHHGPMVEVRRDWVVEGVWDGEFDQGDFDQTDAIFGTGIRKRDDSVFFVSSASGVDRLWSVRQKGEIFVSNSLPGLLELSGLSLRDEYPSYTEDLITVQKIGVFNHVKTIPTDGESLQIVYLKNLLYRDGRLEEIDKPDLAPHFSDFAAYEAYLKTLAARVGANARTPERSFPIDMLVGLSSGYDSIAAAVVSSYAGCNNAASITNSSSFWRGSDSGKHIADRLGMTCQLHRHTKENYRNEIALWAGAGIPGARNFSLFDYPKPLCLFFSGGYGDVIWDRNSSIPQEPKTGINELLCEYRLIEGIFVSVVPWWGIRRAAEIHKINQLDEMKPWTLGTDYDRPIARRLIEEAGIPRGEFAIRKKDTASNSPLRWPSTPSARESFERYLNERGVAVPGPIKVKFYDISSRFLNLTYKNTVKHLGIRKWWRPWLSFPGRHLLFAWANHTLRDTYYREK